MQLQPQTGIQFYLKYQTIVKNNTKIQKINDRDIKIYFFNIIGLHDFLTK